MTDLDDLFEDIKTIAQESKKTEEEEEEEVDWEQIKDQITLLVSSVEETENGRQVIYTERKIEDLSVEELLKWARNTCGLDVDVAESMMDTLSEKDRKSAIFHGTVAAMSLFRIPIDEEVIRDIQESRKKEE